MPKKVQIWPEMAFLFILGQALQAHLVGGCCAWAVSRKTKGPLLRIFSNGWKLKSARSWPGRLKYSPAPVSKVMFHCRPVPTSHLAWPCSLAPWPFSTYFASILGLLSQALLACLVEAGDAVECPGVLAGDALLHGPCLSSQGACVCICVG